MARLTIFWLLTGLLVCCGCSSLATSWQSFVPFVDNPRTAGPKHPVVNVACMWQPGEGRSAEGTPAQGFAGTIYFFTAGQAEPVLVNGDVRVYLFADVGTARQRSRPLHQYDFTPEAWKSHARKSSLGPGYAAFIPFPGHPRYQVRCTLRVRYQPPGGGPPVWSDSLEMVLDGMPRPENAPLTWLDGTEANAAAPHHEMTITHKTISAEKLAKDLRKKAEKTSGLKVETLDVGRLTQSLLTRPDGNEPTGEVVQASYQQPAVSPPRSGRIPRREGQDPSMNAFTRMSGAQRQAAIRQLFARQGLDVARPVPEQGNEKAEGRELADRATHPLSAHPLSGHPLATHPLSESAGHPLADPGRAPRRANDLSSPGGRSRGLPRREPSDGESPRQPAASLPARYSGNESNSTVSWYEAHGFTSDEFYQGHFGASRPNHLTMPANDHSILPQETPRNARNQSSHPLMSQSPRELSN